MHRTPSRPGRRGAAARAATAALLLAVALCATTAAPARAGWWDDAASARETTLTALREQPERWRDVPVVLRLQVLGEAPRGSAFFTQFTADRWRALSVREGEAAEGAAYERVFVRRGGPDDLRLDALRRGKSLLVRAVVRDTAGGEPWIEVLALTGQDDPLTPEEEARVAEADRFLARGNASGAEALYRDVLAARRLADADRARLLRQIGAALYEQRRPADALGVLRESLALAPDDAETRARAERIETALRTRGAAAPDGATPPNAERRSPNPPALRPAETTGPVLLPRTRPTLAPPTGLETPRDDATPPATDAGAAAGAPATTPPETSSAATSTAGAAPPKPGRPLPAAGPEGARPTPPAPPPAAETKAVPKEAPVGDRPAPADDRPAPADEPPPAEPAPPPPPPKSRLSGPK